MALHAARGKLIAVIGDEVVYLTIAIFYFHK